MSLAYNKNLMGARNGGIYMNYSGGPKNNVVFDFKTVADRMEDTKLYGQLIMSGGVKVKNMTKKYYKKLKEDKKTKK